MSSMRYTSLGVMRPPKPPCWRDFVAPSPKSISINSDGVDVADSVGRALGARSPVADVIETSKVAASLPGNKPSRLVRRPRVRIHRTRSEHVIHAEDLPDSSLVATLTDPAGPKGLHVGVLEGPRYVEENNKRCQNWLAGIEAAEPLDEVSYTGKHQSALSSIDEATHRIPESPDNKNTEHLVYGCPQIVQQYLSSVGEQQQEVDVEVPEETFVWDASRRARHESPSSDEDMASVFKSIQEECENTSALPPSSHTICLTHSHLSPTRSPESTPRSPVSTPRSPESTPRSPESTPRSPESTPRSPESTPRSPASTPHSPVSTSRSRVSTPRSPNSHSRCQVSSTCSPNSSQRSPASATCSPQYPASSSRELAYVASNMLHGDQNNRCEIFYGTFRATARKYTEKTHKDKLYKLCCDYRKDDSSSDIGNDCSSRITLNGCCKTQRSCSDIQAGDASPKDSRCSFNSIHTGSSSSELSRTTKLISDSELWALNLSTCD